MQKSLFEILEVKEKWNPGAVIQPGIMDRLVHQTAYGVLYEGNCLELLPLIQDASIDTVFADPPFNLGKKYGVHVNDNRPNLEYVKWCKGWLDESVRVFEF